MKLEEVIKYEFIGAKIKIFDSKNKNNIGVKGKVVNETRNMLELDNGMKLIKDQSVFDINLHGKLFRIDGRLIIGRPEDRLKKQLK